MLHTKSLSKKLLALLLIVIFSLLLSGTVNAQTCPDDMSHYWKLDETGTPTDFFDSYVGINNAYCSSGTCPSPATGLIGGAQ